MEEKHIPCLSRRDLFKVFPFFLTEEDICTSYLTKFLKANIVSMVFNPIYNTKTNWKVCCEIIYILQRL